MRALLIAVLQMIVSGVLLLKGLLCSTLSAQDNRDGGEPQPLCPRERRCRTQAETRCHRKTQRGVQVPTAGKHSYSAGRRQGFLWRREKSGLWERIRGRYGPQEEKIRGKVNKRKGMKGGTCAMRQNEEERKRHWGEGKGSHGGDRVRPRPREKRRGQGVWALEKVHKSMAGLSEGRMAQPGLPRDMCQSSVEAIARESPRPSGWKSDPSCPLPGTPSSPGVMGGQVLTWYDLGLEVSWASPVRSPWRDDGEIGTDYVWSRWPVRVYCIRHGGVGEEGTICL